MKPVTQTVECGCKGEWVGDKYCGTICSKHLVELAKKVEPPRLPVVFSTEEATKLGAYIHYPKCWDTAAYPSLRDAIYQIVMNAGCSEHPLHRFQPFDPARIG